MRDAAIILGLLLLAMTIRVRRWGNLVSPMVIRNDAAGSGRFGAPRGRRSHQGIDILVKEGDPIYAPFTGRFIRKARPYANDSRFDGIVLHGNGYELKIFYLAPLDSLRPHQMIRQNQLIGIAQGISRKYGGSMRDHLHIEVRRIVGAELLNPEQLFEDLA
jgi:murein DD-endopeptidase MepM/ murein hydrolase activator NlpD